MNAKVGRKKKFETEELMKIIENYLTDNKYVIKLKYVDLVKYSKRNGDKNIFSQDFIRNNNVKEFIKNFNNNMVKMSEKREVEFVDIDVENILESNDKVTQKAILHLYRENYRKAFEELKVIDKEKNELIARSKDREKKIEDLWMENKELKQKMILMKKQNNDNNKNLKEIRAINGIEYLYEKNIIGQLSKKELQEVLINIFDVRVSDNLVLDQKIVKETPNEKNGKVLYIPEIF